MSKTKGIIPDTFTHCLYCEHKFTVSQYVQSKERRPTRDHFVPVSKGGANRVENLYIVCQYCNTLKGNFQPYEFIYWIACKIRWKEYPTVAGFTYTDHLLNVVKKNIRAIYNYDADAVPSLSVTQSVPVMQRKKDRKTPTEFVEKSGIHYCNYLGVSCPCVGFIDRALSNLVKQYQNAYYHSGEEKYVFVTKEQGVVAYYKKTIQQYIKPFFPNDPQKSTAGWIKKISADVHLSVNTNTPKVYAPKTETLDEQIARLLSEPSENFHYHEQ